MQYNDNSKQRFKGIQGLRSFKDTLPKNIKKIIYKKGHIYSETLNNWRYIVGENLFKSCYPKSFKSSNKFRVNTLIVVVKRGNEVDLEYSKKEIMERMNNFFGYQVVEKLKLISFDDGKNSYTKKNAKIKNETNSIFKKKINDIKNKKIKKSLEELLTFFEKR